MAALCRALDGMALAIELAAARFADARPRRAGGRPRPAAAVPHRRHRGEPTGTARCATAIGWSYDLLAPDDRALLRGIAVFASWFDVDAARAVAGAGRERAEVADGLARLADHSLLVVERGEPTRYRALETIRQYGVERLEPAGELAADPGPPRAVVPRRGRRARRQSSPTTPGATGSTGSSTTFGAALAWSAGDERRRAQAAQLAADLAGLLFVRGRPVQAQRRYEQAATSRATAARAS